MVNLLKRYAETVYCWFLDFKKYDRAAIREIIDKETGMFEALDWAPRREVSECTCEWFESEDPEVIGCVCPPNKLVYEFTKEQYYDELLKTLPFMWDRGYRRATKKNPYTSRHKTHIGRGQLRTYLREQRELWEKSKTWPDASIFTAEEQERRRDFFGRYASTDPLYIKYRKEREGGRDLRLFFKE